MKHARSDYDRIQGPANLIPADEPVFLIRGQDIAAAPAVRAYAEIARQQGADPELVRTAEKHADLMDAWPKKKVPDLA